MAKLPCIVLVDDDATANFLNRKLLERLQVSDQVLIALNGREALDLLQARQAQPPTDAPCLVLLDVNMPVMNGIQFLEAYQHWPPAQQRAALIVVLTTSAHPQDMQQLQHLPAAAFLSKPLTAEKIAHVLHQHFPEHLGQVPAPPAR